MNTELKGENVFGEDAAAAVAAELVRLSVWFEVTPYPDDEWNFVVKGEAFLLLQAAISRPPRAVDAGAQGI